MCHNIGRNSHRRLRLSKNRLRIQPICCIDRLNPHPNGAIRPLKLLGWSSLKPASQIYLKIDVINPNSALAKSWKRPFVEKSKEWEAAVQCPKFMFFTESQLRSDRCKWSCCASNASVLFKPRCPVATDPAHSAARYADTPTVPLVLCRLNCRAALAAFGRHDLE